MQHLDLYCFYELATKLHGLFSVETQMRAAKMFGPLTEAQSALDALIKGDPIVLESSKADAIRLLGKISDLFDKYFIDSSTKQMKASEGEDHASQHEIAVLRSLVEKFEHALAAELNRVPSYIAEKLGIYSIQDMIENASSAFSAAHRAAVAPTALTEFNTGGRAIAFGLGTAAAVHLLRATEIVLRQYYELFSKGPSGKGERNYSIYLKKLSLLADDESLSDRPDRRVIQMLAQIKEHYRNPLITPEVSMTTEQATSLFGLSNAIISMMAEQIAARKQGGRRLSSIEEKEAEDEEETYDFRAAKPAA
jgi:hypothetical protein